MTILKGLSSQELRALAKRAIKLAEDLKATRPSKEMALEFGIRDLSYNTQSNGYVSSYAGETIIKMADGKRWRAVGHPPDGDAYSIYRQGYIEFFPLDD